MEKEREKERTGKRKRQKERERTYCNSLSWQLFLGCLTRKTRLSLDALLYNFTLIAVESWSSQLSPCPCLSRPLLSSFTLSALYTLFAPASSLRFPPLHLSLSLLDIVLLSLSLLFFLSSLPLYPSSSFLSIYPSLIIPSPYSSPCAHYL